MEQAAVCFAEMSERGYLLSSRLENMSRVARVHPMIRLDLSSSLFRCSKSPVPSVDKVNN